jgi:ABC-2 type transport system permease protein
LTETQLIAAMFTYGIVLLLWNLSWNEAAVPNSWLGLVSQLCAYDHFEPFSRGVIDLRDVAYFVAITVFMWFLTMRSMESRQWRGRR